MTELEIEKEFSHSLFEENYELQNKLEKYKRALDAATMLRRAQWSKVKRKPADLLGYYNFTCSLCESYNTYGTTSFCPHCGALMVNEQGEPV